MVNLEKIEASKIGARLHKNSGRGKNEKADASNDKFVIDFKNFKNSFSLSRKIWAKICTDAWKTDPNKSPLLMLILGEGQDKVRLAVVEWSVLEMLLEEKDGNSI